MKTGQWLLLKWYFMDELPKILLVEKEQSVIDQIVAAAKTIGFQTPEIAGSFEEAKKIVGTKKPGIALVDYELESRGDDGTTHGVFREEFNVPVIYLVSSETDILKKEIQSPYGFIHKPVDRRNLKKSIMQAITRHNQMDYYRQFLDDIPVPSILISSANYEVIKTNPAFKSLFPDIYERHSLNTFTNSNGNLARNFIALITKLGKSNKTVSSSFVLHTAKGEKSFNLVASCMDSLGKSVILFSCIETTDQNSEDLFALAPIMLLQLDLSGCIRLANKKWLSETGYKETDITGKQLTSLLVDSSDETITGQSLANLTSGGREYKIQLDIRRANGEVAAYQVEMARSAKGDNLLAVFNENRIIPEINKYKEEAILSNALRDTASALTSTLNFDEVLDRILINVGEVVPNEAANVMMIWSDVAYIVRSIGYAERGIEEEMMSLQMPVNQESHFLSMYTTGMPLAVSDIQEYAALEHHSRINWARSIASAPLLSKGQVFGFLNLESSQPGFYDQTHADRLQAFADQAAVAIENARLYAEVQQFAITDELTDIYNRRGLFELGKREVERARRYGRSLSAVMIDTDKFKDINDTYSHAVGDHVLRAMADRWRKTIREVDILGRYGGDEFVVLLPETELESAVQVADRLRQVICSTPIETPTGDIVVSVSVGVSAINDEITIFDTLIEKADQMMYTAKTTGRNRVIHS